MDGYDKFLSDFSNFNKNSRNAQLISSRYSPVDYQLQKELPIETREVLSQNEVENRVNKVLKSLKEKFKPNQIEETVFAYYYFTCLKILLTSLLFSERC